MKLMKQILTYMKLFDDDDATGRTATPRPHSRHRGRNPRLPLKAHIILKKLNK